MNTPTAQLRETQDLSRRAREGSCDAFMKLASPHAQGLMRYLMHKAPSLHDAEDLLQETMLRAFANIHRYHPDKPFAAWLFTIATRLAISQYRARKTSADIDCLTLHDVKAHDPHEQLQKKEQRDSLWDAAKHLLSPDQFDVLWLKYAQDMSVGEIASAVGKTQIHVKVLLHRARKKMLSAEQAGAKIQASDGNKPLSEFSRGETCGVK